jgi:hypothetical protein
MQNGKLSIRKDTRPQRGAQAAAAAPPG